jgi:hypothetical protein
MQSDGYCQGGGTKPNAEEVVYFVVCNWVQKRGSRMIQFGSLCILGAMTRLLDRGRHELYVLGAPRVGGIYKDKKTGNCGGVNVEICKRPMKTIKMPEAAGIRMS